MPAEAMLPEDSRQKYYLSNHPRLIGLSRFRPRTFLPSWRQAIGKGGLLLLWLLPCHLHYTASSSETKNPRSDGYRASLVHLKESVLKNLGLEEENPKSMEDLRAFTRRPTTDCRICRRCDQSTPVHSILDTPIWGGHRNQGDWVTSRVYSPVRVKRSGIELMRM